MLGHSVLDGVSAEASAGAGGEQRIDYERRPEHHEAMVLWATVMIMTRQLVRTTAGAPPHPRWGRPRAVASTPERQDQQAA